MAPWHRLPACDSESPSEKAAALMHLQNDPKSQVRMPHREGNNPIPDRWHRNNNSHRAIIADDARHHSNQFRCRNRAIAIGHRVAAGDQFLSAAGHHAMREQPPITEKKYDLACIK